MTTYNFEEFDNSFDLTALRTDLKEIEFKSNKTEFKEVPFDDYDVKIQKLELVLNKNNRPMVSCWFKILAGEYKNQLIFMNQVVDSSFLLHKCNEFLRSITSLPVTTENFTFKDYSLLLMDIMEEIEGKREFILGYSQDAKGYKTFKIKQVFEVQG